ncbi:MAG: lysine--tRNA ligase [Desulfobacula sp.]|jgi:lysyl-tRNA synthetase class 2|uniref:lysine--tRNA ligase n=1 Tax=Desulfobacula sp. TaxID=2593537 RepID=UPI001D6EA0B0|nr:lysine--tRNA ligase [Desulfobacula sp.]MBT3484435.1 lysine--tRNA ligase [Desulfobacula sp.]MBT3803350.1 lysine--tRNA ligase [Desulfobacula sp.]MBT4023683.1 lysine--tRNA ligase [Desulfobacula sp.]MBT4197925.1 lysine--tRNA ligase [Desulfobacula sp.]
MDKESKLIQVRKEKINELKESGVNLYPNDFRPSCSIKTLRQIIKKTPDALGEKGDQFYMAGRMMAINKMGKSSFVRFKDGSDQLQIYLQKNSLGDETYSLFKKLDIGDFIGVKGPLFQTRTGEWTLLAKEFRLISKAVRPLPEKFHGIKDPEKRYRQRYLDLITNEETRQIFIKRSKIVASMRRFFEEKGFMEVETPMMQPLAGGAEATPFKTWHNALGMELFLRIAPELYLKRLVVGGFEKVFEINRNFRNEGVSARHNPEFTMVEFYQAYADYKGLMDLTEEMFESIVTQISDSTIIEYQGQLIDFKKGWQRIPMIESLTKIGGIDPAILNDTSLLLNFAQEKNIHITKKDRHGKILTKLFDSLVEPRLIQPTFITGYPVEVSPLSRKNDDNPELTDRFELFIAGREIANGFSEINDPEDQYNRFLMQVRQRDEGNSEAHIMDSEYVEALEYGMPPTAGEGIGIDRLVMLLTNAASIREVILFPHMKKNI